MSTLDKVWLGKRALAGALALMVMGLADGSKDVSIAGVGKTVVFGTAFYFLFWNLNELAAGVLLKPFGLWRQSMFGKKTWSTYMEYEWRSRPSKTRAAILQLVARPEVDVNQDWVTLPDRTRKALCRHAQHVLLKMETGGWGEDEAMGLAPSR